jgi:hypothetical protein
MARSLKLAAALVSACAAQQLRSYPLRIGYLRAEADRVK